MRWVTTVCPNLFLAYSVVRVRLRICCQYDNSNELLVRIVFKSGWIYRGSAGKGKCFSRRGENGSAGKDQCFSRKGQMHTWATAVSRRSEPLLISILSKPVYNSHSQKDKIGFQDRLSLNAGQKHSAILLALLSKTFVLHIFE